MTTEDKVKTWQEQQAKYELGGGQKAIDRVHEQGKCTARERIEQFVDPGTFREANLWAKPTKTGFDIDKREAPGDAAVIGTAEVNGRPLSLYAHDFTIMGGTQASVQNWKICKAINNAVKLGIPYVGIIDSGGVRIYDAFGATSGKCVSHDCDVWLAPARASGIVPSISVCLGASYAGTAYSPILADVFFMVKKPHCYMSLSSPELLKTVTFADVTREEIGSPTLHAEITGSCDFLGESEEECLEKARELLSFLPSNCWGLPPVIDTADDTDRNDDTIMDLIPADMNKPYDMHDIITSIIDNSHFLELKQDYAKNIITGFARLGGQSVGIVANNPMFLDGCLDLKASDKEARFIRYCDCFNVPLVFLVDTPGFAVAPQQEKEGLARHAAMVMHAICEATVPKITVYMRKCYGDGYLAMNSRGMGSDFLFAWPTAQIQLVDFNMALEAAYNKPAADIDAQQLEEFRNSLFNSPYSAGALLMFDAIIHPGETRKSLITALRTSAGKINREAEIRPWKKHGNIPL